MTANSRRPADAPVRGPFPPLYPIVDVDLCRLRGVAPPELARAFFSAGARLLQVRQKGTGTGEFVDVVTAIVAAGRPLGAAVLVNDRADVALLAGAAGVHVGQQDLPVPAVRDILGPAAIVGLSTHTPEQIDAALRQAVDYIAVGPVFSTATKDTGYEPRGLDLVASAANRGKPVVAIGGITLERCAAPVAAGASAVAIISDLLTGGAPEARAKAILERLPRQTFNV